MASILIAGGVGVFIGFTLGVFVMALVKVAEPVPTPDALHVHPFRQEQDAARTERDGDQAGREHDAHEGDTVSARPTIRTHPIAWMRDGALAAWTVAVIFCFSVMVWVLQ